LAVRRGDRHLHGGWFNFGSAKAYRHLVGHIAARAGNEAFIRTIASPEHPFPAATDDVLAWQNQFRLKKLAWP